MAGTIQAGTLISSNSRSIDVDDIGVRSYAGGGGAFNYRNKLVDGRFDFWYEGTNQTTSGYGSDTMWKNTHTGSSKTHSRQPLTPGVDLPAIEVPTAKYFSRTVVTSVAGSGNRVAKFYEIENVRTLAGKTVTFSFYAKADAARSIGILFSQNFGTGGSTKVFFPTGGVLFNITTSWARYSATFVVPSVSGKTIATDGTDSIGGGFYFDAGSATALPALGQQSGTFDIACVQLEEGSVATPFEELPIEVSQQRLSRYFKSWLPISQWGYICLCYFEELTIANGAIPNTFRATPTLSYRGAFELERRATTITGISIGLWSSDTLRIQVFCSDPQIIGEASALRFSNDANAAIFLDARL